MVEYFKQLKENKTSKVKTDHHHGENHQEKPQALSGSGLSQ
jgi:hypothetical protein